MLNHVVLPDVSCDGDGCLGGEGGGQIEFSNSVYFCPRRSSTGRRTGSPAGGPSWKKLLEMIADEGLEQAKRVAAAVADGDGDGAVGRRGDSKLATGMCPLARALFQHTDGLIPFEYPPALPAFFLEVLLKTRFSFSFI